MSHEIRTPMTAILGFAETLLEPEQTDAERRSAAHTIRRNGEYLLGIINDILDLSKIEAGKMTVERIACRPCEIIAEVASLVRIRLEGKGLAFAIEFVGTIPETIRTNPTRLRQILINLIGNAIKFTEEGGVRLITRFVDGGGTEKGFSVQQNDGGGTEKGFSVQQNDGGETEKGFSVRDAEAGDASFMQFDVLDTGIGMTEEQRVRLFQPFTQADNSTTRKFGGTGLGLTISKRFAEMLGGGITVESKPGEGTLFRVPIATGSAAGVRMIEDPRSETVVRNDPTGSGGVTARSALEGCHILLAEDGRDNQRLIGHVLKKAGADVTVKENGRLAFDAALAARDKHQPFDVILMDMQMPVMAGYEATRRLREKGYTEPIIALTAHAMATDRQKCLDAGCDDYATKPIDRKKLIATIQSHLHATAIA